MAQAQPKGEFRGVQEKVVLKHDNKHNNKDNNNSNKKKKRKDNNALSSRSGGAFRFNAHAPEFVPRATPKQGAAPVPVSGFIIPCFQLYPTSQCANNNTNGVLTEQLQYKIIKQVEYQFSDMSLLANENLLKQIEKDTEGYVPIAAVSSTKKLKSINNSNHNLIVEALRASTKLDVSSDGTRVKRKNPFTEKEKEELQLRTVVAENLPDDHSHQNLEKIFKVAGVVKTVRVCHPQEPTTRGKGDCVVSTKLHALVEFENVESAEKAVEKLNDERNWRKGLRVRLLIRRTPKSVLKNRKSAFDGYLDEEEEHQVVAGVEDNSQVQQQTHAPNQSQAHQQNKTEPVSVYNNAEDTATSSKKPMFSKGRGKPIQQRGLLSQLSIESSAKQAIKGPRMPDGSKGFNMGRGRPISIPV